MERFGRLPTAIHFSRLSGIAPIQNNAAPLCKSASLGEFSS